MSNTASQPLCQELYELLEWKGTDFVYASHVNAPIYRSGGHLKSGIVPDYPAYTLGYLMRKLPKGTYIQHYDSNDDVYAAVHGDPETRISRTRQANTPEDALCKLAIELAKAGILKREES